jgi:signal transduction histidine kinase/PAS domain-containing protein
MHLVYNPYMLLPLFAMLMAVFLWVRGWRYHSSRMGKTYLALMGALAWWSLAVVMEHWNQGLASKIFWIKMSYFGIVSLPVAWMIFTAQYTGREKWLTARNVSLMFIVPLITLIMVWTNGMFHLMWKDIWLDTSINPPVDAVTHNLWFWAHSAYSYALLLIGTFYLLDLFRKSRGIFRQQAGILLLAALVPWVGNILFLAGIKPFSVVDPTPITFAITGVAFFWGLSRLQLLDIIMPVAHETILKSMADGIIILDTHLRVIELNPAAQRIIGGKKSDTLGQIYSRVFPGQMGLLELNADMPETEAAVFLSDGQNQRSYSVRITPIGTAPHVNGRLVILRDDTERVKAELESKERAILQAELNERNHAAEAIQRRLEFEETIARVSSRFVRISDLDATINDSLADIGKLSQSSRAYLFLLGENNIMTNTHNWYADAAGPQVNKFLPIPGNNFPEWMTELKNGNVIHIPDVPSMYEGAEKEMLQRRDIKSALVLPIAIDRQLIGLIGFDNIYAGGKWDDNDIALLRMSAEIIGNALERKQATDQLAKLNEELKSFNSQLEIKVEERTKQLEEAVEVAEASNRTKSEFLASMSHELRTPLNAIIGFSQVLHEQYFGELNEKQAEYIADIVDSGKHLLSLINDILDLSKIEAGKMELDISEVKIAELLQGSLVMIKEKAMAHNISLDLKIAENINGTSIKGDERRLKQVMFNLLSNSAKFTPDGGAIKVEAEMNDKELTVSVTDTGIGMTPQEQKRLFEAFYQASGGIKGKTPGTGLGLAITRSIIEKHGGRIWMESGGPNKGSTFSFTLPFAKN